MKKVLFFILAMVMTLSFVGCGGETVTMVDVTTEQGISLKLPSDLKLQDNFTYTNTETGDNAVFAASEVDDFPISSWTEEDVLTIYESKYKDVSVVSFENGKEINGKEALVTKVNLTTPKGNPVTLTLVMVTDGTKNYIVNFTYANNNSEGSLAKNLQACIDSITIK